MLRGLLLSCFTACAVLAQAPSASIVGRVTDASGAVIPGVPITVTNLDTNLAARGESNGSGEYTIPYLNPGRYSLEAKSEGFRLHRRNEFTLAVDQVLRLDLSLEIGATTESVTVTDTPPLLNTENGARGDVTTNEEIKEMPLAGRNFSDLAYLTGGVIPKGEDGDGAYAINGARADNVGFLIDGMNNTQRRNTGAMVNPPLEGVQEFKMITSGFSAEYGRYAGGILSVVMKSGGNRFHGSLYEFIRNDLIDARGFFELEKSVLRRNQFGATLSGPVRIPKLYDGRDKTFFLFSWESLRSTAGANQRGIVPQPEMLRGDFTKATDALGRPLAIKDPLNRNLPFAGNQIPVSRLDPVALNLASYYPQPNLPFSANNYIAQANSEQSFNNFSLKGDHSLSPRDRLTLSTFWRPNTSYNPFNRSPIPLFGATTATFELLSGIRYLRTVSPSLFMELGVSFSRRTNNQGWPDNTRDWAAEAGFTGGTKNPVALGLPQVDATGYITLGHAYDLPKVWSYNNYQYNGSFTYIRGRHNMKFGADFLRYQYFSRNYGDMRGRMTFLGRFTNEPMADFVLGYAQTTRRQMDAAGPYHLVSNYSGFFQDDWKISPTLTLNFGLRYELMKPPQEKFGAWSMFVPSLGKIVVAGTGTLPDFDARIAETGLQQYVAKAADAGMSRSLVRPDYNNFGPRFGFAWRPFGGTKSVIRGGYGIFYGTSSLYRLDEYSDTYPFSINESYSATSSNPLLLTVSDPYPVAKRRVGGITSTAGQQIDSRDQYLQSWNLTLERDFGKGTVLEVAYAGSKGTHLPRRYDINQPLRLLEVRNADGSFPRPFPAFQTINYIAASSNSTYNSGSLTIRRRFSKQMFVRAAYTWAKSIDESSNTGGTIAAGFPSAQDSRNLHGERGRSDFDIGHSFVASFIWTPKLTNNLMLRNWQVAGTTRAYTGQPFTPKVANVSLDLGEAVRPDRIAKGTLDTPTVDAWFDRAALPTVPRGSYRFGNSGRNILDGPGIFLLDASLSRRFRFSESGAFQFRLESFNMPNHTNLSLPETRVDVLNGATISKARAARVFQLGLRMEF
ncbi:MAG: carboxypeptidase regulatory-like domain-containing protein [Acidobacteria bacterium]|nr:carboxypeptidase regulatory-like domain-containing protein [Acidobacteriota bacterium]